MSTVTCAFIYFELVVIALHDAMLFLQPQQAASKRNVVESNFRMEFIMVGATAEEIVVIRKPRAQRSANTARRLPVSGRGRQRRSDHPTKLTRVKLA